MDKLGRSTTIVNVAYIFKTPSKKITLKLKRLDSTGRTSMCKHLYDGDLLHNISEMSDE